MAKRTIELLGADVLRRPAMPVAELDDELRSLIADMYETMRHAEGIGLAGPQIGESRRVVVIEALDEDSEPLALVNPQVVESSKEVDRAEEGCLSLPGLTAVIERPSRVTVEAVDPEGEPLRIEADDLLARVLQHEIDHLDGVLILDKVSPLKRRMLLRKWKKRT